ncbi:putative ATP-dependent DNA helicase RecQ, zinc-binding domain-containing protein [Helianthus annuus]|nr:putative ATP-dependent DNA helicase RecQ, zinc-binding domain-containing protein [Helianthus annuus]
MYFLSQARYCENQVNCRHVQLANYFCQEESLECKDTCDNCWDQENLKRKISLPLQ